MNYMYPLNPETFGFTNEAPINVKTEPAVMDLQRDAKTPNPQHPIKSQGLFILGLILVQQKPHDFTTKHRNSDQFLESGVRFIHHHLYGRI